MRRFVTFIVLFVLVDGNQLRTYTGQTEEQIQASVKSEGKSVAFINEDEFNTRVAANQAKQANQPLSVPAESLEDRVKALEDSYNTLNQTVQESISDVQIKVVN